MNDVCVRLPACVRARVCVCARAPWCLGRHHHLFFCLRVSGTPVPARYQSM